MDALATLLPVHVCVTECRAMIVPFLVFNSNTLKSTHNQKIFEVIIREVRNSHSHFDSASVSGEFVAAYLK